MINIEDYIADIGDFKGSFDREKKENSTITAIISKLITYQVEAVQNYSVLSSVC